MIYLLLLIIFVLLMLAYHFCKLIDKLENSAEDSMFFFSRKKHNKID
jgi:hypothetical protein